VAENDVVEARKIVEDFIKDSTGADDFETRANGWETND